jgi:uncharacterized membrane protein
MRKRTELIRKLVIIIIIASLIFNMIYFLRNVKEMQILDPPKSEQIFISEPQIDSIQ